MDFFDMLFWLRRKVVPLPYVMIPDFENFGYPKLFWRVGDHNIWIFLVTKIRLRRKVVFGSSVDDDKKKTNRNENEKYDDAERTRTSNLFDSTLKSRGAIHSHFQIAQKSRLLRERSRDLLRRLLDDDHGFSNILQNCVLVLVLDHSWWRTASMT